MKSEPRTMSRSHSPPADLYWYFNAMSESVAHADAGAADETSFDNMFNRLLSEYVQVRDALLDHDGERGQDVSRGTHCLRW